MKIGIPISSSKTQYFINQEYVQYVAKAGFEPILIPPEMSESLVFDIIEGLILPGGIDLDPIFYGEDNYTSYSVDPIKDTFERNLFHKAMKLNIPIFGICRGFQLIAREYMIHDPDMLEFLDFSENISYHNQVNDQTLSRDIHQHFVDFVPSLLYGKKGVELEDSVYSLPVNSMHHQCLIADFKQKNITGHRAFRMAAWTRRGLKEKTTKASYPVVCEAFRILKWGSPILAVQWHPEEIKDYTLIQQFFNAPKKVKKTEFIDTMEVVDVMRS